MNGREKQIGFSQRIRLEWFEQTVNLILAGNERNIICESLRDLLRDKVSVASESKRCNREKIITILLRTWLSVPRELETLRDEGLEILQELTRKDRIAVHWSMAQAVYPFWGTVATHTGRLLRLQGAASAAHVQRRVKETYGERETASRATQRVLRSFVDWGVLNDTRDKGLYVQGDQYPVAQPRLIAWMVEASLHARAAMPAGRTRSSGAATVSELLDGPGIFPFRMSHVSAECLASLSPRLDILRYALDTDLVMLREQGF